MELLFMIKYFQEDLAIFSLNLSNKRKQKERKGHSEGFFFWGGGAMGTVSSLGMVIGFLPWQMAFVHEDRQI